MTDPQALELARRIASCWRGGYPLAEWVAELAPLDHGPAVATFERLRKLLADPGPSIPRFLSEYRALTAPVVTEPWREPLSGPRLSREERERLLTAAGAKRELITNRAPGFNPPAEQEQQ